MLGQPTELQRLLNQRLELIGFTWLPSGDGEPAWYHSERNVWLKQVDTTYYRLERPGDDPRGYRVVAVTTRKRTIQAIVDHVTDQIRDVLPHQFQK